MLVFSCFLKEAAGVKCKPGSLRTVRAQSSREVSASTEASNLYNFLRSSLSHGQPWATSLMNAAEAVRT